VETKVDELEREEGGGGCKSWTLWEGVRKEREKQARKELGPDSTVNGCAVSPDQLDISFPVNSV
jgi:hypothetical protein